MDRAPYPHASRCLEAQKRRHRQFPGIHRRVGSARNLNKPQAATKISRMSGADRCSCSTGKSWRYAPNIPPGRRSRRFPARSRSTSPMPTTLPVSTDHVRRNNQRALAGYSRRQPETYPQNQYKPKVKAEPRGGAGVSPAKHQNGRDARPRLSKYSVFIKFQLPSFWICQETS